MAGKLFYIKSIDGTYELHSYDLATGKDAAFYKEEAGKRNMIYCDRVVVVKNPEE